jgi:hypothetical protein
MKPILFALILLALPACCPRPWTKIEVGWAVTGTLAAGGDYYTTKRLVVDGDGKEYNPLIRANPLLGIVLGHMLALWIADQAAEIKLWGMTFEVRNTLLPIKTGANTACVINNMGEL